MLEQELGNLLPPSGLATTCRRWSRWIRRSGLQEPDHVHRSALRDEAERLTRDKGWVFKPDGNKWRRVVASPEPKRVFELRAIKLLLERNTIVIAAGGGGIPDV